MATTVRRARAEDAEAIAVVNLASWEAAYRGIAPDAFLDAQSVPDRATLWRELITAGDLELMVAEDDGVLAAYCRMETPSRDEDASADTAKIRAFYVAPTSFRRGVGSSLMTAARGRLAEAGFAAVTLWVLSANATARAFYERHGFSPDGGESFWLEDIEQIRLRRLL